MASTVIFSLLSLLISVMITIPPSAMSSPKTPVQGFEARLIHRDSPQSPLYNPKATPADLIKSARRRIIARQNYFKWLMSGKTRRNSISAPIDRDHGDYIMRYKVGTPRVDSFGIFDTASDLIWFQCKPCEKCYEQGIPIFDPANSDTYQKVMCGSIECNTTSDAHCPDPKGECQYKIAYQDGASTEGDIATETIMLEHDGSSGNINLTNMIIGCGHTNVETIAGHHPPGVVGLSRESSSLVGQISYPHLSYCISSENNGTYNNSNVKIGLPAVVTETEAKIQTPLLSGENGLYYLSLEGISVDGAMLNVSSSVFNMTAGGEGGVFMDSATTYTMLAFEAFSELEKVIVNTLSDFHRVGDYDGIFIICYDDSRFQVDKTPEIVFHFTGLEFPVSANNTWAVNSQGHYCLAMLPSFAGFTIFGMYQHRNVNVGYDFNNNVTSFKYTNFCQYT